MRTLLIALALVAAACGGSKKPSTTPAPTEEKAIDEDADERDAARPDDADDMPAREMADPCNDE